MSGQVVPSGMVQNTPPPYLPLTPAAQRVMDDGPLKGIGGGLLDGGPVVLLEDAVMVFARAVYCFRRLSQLE